MEHIPARHAAKVGMRYPARVVDTSLIGLSLQLDLSGLAPGRTPVLDAHLFFGQSIGTNYARTLAIGERIEVVLIDVNATVGLVASLPANPKWLAWNNGTVRHLARRIRETGETVLIPVLGDALEDAGCTDAIVLEHLRQDPDERSWVVELLATQE
jgi:hypothetical protein